MRIVTPGTLTEDALLDARRHNYLAALADASGELAIAWLDLSTGEFATAVRADAPRSAPRWRASRPASCCCPSGSWRGPSSSSCSRRSKDNLTPQPSARFDSENGRKRLEALYGVRELGGFGAFTRAEVAAAGALVDYVELTQQGKLPALLPRPSVSAAAR